MAPCSLHCKRGSLVGNVKSHVLSHFVSWVNFSGLVTAGYRVVCAVFAGALVGLRALWLRLPGVRGRMVGGLSRLATRDARSPRPTSRRRRVFALVGTRVVSSCSLPLSMRSVLSRRRGFCGRPAERLASHHHAMEDHGALACQGRTGLLVAGSRPVLERMGAAHHRKQAVGGLVQEAARPASPMGPAQASAVTGPTPGTVISGRQPCRDRLVQLRAVQRRERGQQRRPRRASLPAPLGKRMPHEATRPWTCVVGLAPLAHQVRASLEQDPTTPLFTDTGRQEAGARDLRQKPGVPGIGPVCVEDTSPHGPDGHRSRPPQLPCRADPVPASPTASRSPEQPDTGHAPSTPRTTPEGRSAPCLAPGSLPRRPSRKTPSLPSKRQSQQTQPMVTLSGSSVGARCPRPRITAPGGVTAGAQLPHPHRRSRQRRRQRHPPAGRRPGTHHHRHPADQAAEPRPPTPGGQPRAHCSHEHDRLRPRPSAQQWRRIITLQDTWPFESR